MRTNYVLIDYENLQVDSLELLQPEHFKLRIFLGPNNTKLPSELAIAAYRLHDRADYIQLETPGKNALDFHLAYYLGRLAFEEPAAYFHIISGDKGFDPLIKHLKGKGISAARSESIEGLPCFIKSFRDAWLEAFFVHDEHAKQIPADISNRLFRKLQLLDDATTDSDLRIPPSNHFEKLVGKLKGLHSNRVNQQWRLVFEWDGDKGEASGVYLDNHSY